MNKINNWKLALVRNWELPLKERLANYFIPSLDPKTKEPYFTGIVQTGSNALMHIDTSSYIEYKIFSLGSYEIHLSRLMTSFISDGDTVLDIGANVGVHTLNMANATGSKGKVIAVEPVIFNRERLKANIKLNRFNHVEVLPFAFSDSNQTVKIKADPKAYNKGSFHIGAQVDGDMEIQCKIGDEVLEKLHIANVKFIKIDVEGFEFQVLKGLQRTIQNCKPVIIFEFDINYIRRAGINEVEFEKWLTTSGYQLWSIERHYIRPLKTLSDNYGQIDVLCLPQ
jgi:FkbM family methyltransferase